MAYSPLAVGLLTGAYVPGEPPPAGSLWAINKGWGYAEKMQGPTGDVISTVIEIAADLGKTPAQVALAWVLSHPEVTVAIIGGDTPAHVEDNVGAIGWTLDAATKERLDAVSEIFL